MNKYQEAFNKIKNAIKELSNLKDEPQLLLEEELNLFQELIKKNEQLEERYKLLKESYDELLGNAVKLQEGICPLCENYKENACGCYFPVFKQKMIKKINEHFDNPPLKFEELKDLMVVWDNKQKEYIQCLEFHNDQWRYYRFGDEILYIFQFEENRFYRYEVVENEN